MKELEINIRVCNRFLNKMMKKDYGYDCIFRIDPIHYIGNRVLPPSKFHLSEKIIIKYNKNPLLIDLDKIEQELLLTTNFLFNFIEGRDYREILQIDIRVV